MPSIKKLLSSPVWGIVGLLVTAAAFLYALYLGQRVEKPKITYTITSEYNVVDIHKAMPDLVVLYKGNDIQKSNQYLKIVRLQIQNVGETDIRPNDFDAGLPWGIVVQNAQMISDTIPISDCSTPYLKENLFPRRAGSDTIVINKVILERGRSFTIELSMIHERQSKPQLRVIGKIVGIDSMIVSSEIVGAYDTDKELRDVRSTLNAFTAASFVVSAIFLTFLVMSVRTMQSEKEVIVEERRALERDKQSLNAAKEALNTANERTKQSITALHVNRQNARNVLIDQLVRKSYPSANTAKELRDMTYHYSEANIPEYIEMMGAQRDPHYFRKALAIREDFEKRISNCEVGYESQPREVGIQNVLSIMGLYKSHDIAKGIDDEQFNMIKNIFAEIQEFDKVSSILEHQGLD